MASRFKNLNERVENLEKQLAELIKKVESLHKTAKWDKVKSANNEISSTYSWRK